MKTKKNSRKSSSRRSLDGVVSRRERENRAIDALIALALRGDMQKEPTDAEIAQFLKECDQGKHKLNAETKAALDRAGHDLMLKLKEHMGKTGNTIYGKPANGGTEPPEAKC